MKLYGKFLRFNFVTFELGQRCLDVYKTENFIFDEQVIVDVECSPTCSHILFHITGKLGN